MEILLLPLENKLKEKVIAIILCAGEGTRIRDFSQNIPKSLIKIASLNESSIIDYLILSLTNLRIQKIVIITGYLGSQLKEHFSTDLIDNKSLKDKLTFIDSGQEYKKGPLYSFLSFTNNAKIFRKRSIFVLFPCDTIFENVLLKEIFKMAFLNLKLIKNFPSIFYKKLDTRLYREKYEQLNDTIPKSLSIIKTERVGKENILKKIIKTELHHVSEKNIKLLIPVLFLNYYSVKHFQKISNLFPVNKKYRKKIKEILYLPLIIFDAIKFYR